MLLSGIFYMFGKAERTLARHIIKLTIKSERNKILVGRAKMSEKTEADVFF